MSGAKRNSDTLNTVGIVVVGICGAVLVYVSITALQAFYANDSSDIQTMADYGGQDTSVKNLKAAQMGSINEYGPNAAPAAPKAGEPVKSQTYHMAIADAKKLVIEPKADPANLIPALGRSDKPTVMPVYGRPKALPGATPAPGTGSAAGSAEGSGAGSAAIPETPTGTGSGSATAAGSGSASKGNGP
jgi:hypothetical protein